MRKIMVMMMALLFVMSTARAADANQLYYALRDKVLKVKNYTADVKIKIDVAYMKIPEVKGKLYFKFPDKMRLERSGGLSILPKKNINMTLSNLMPAGNVTALDAGYETIGMKKTRIIKVIPDDENSNIVLAKLWIDEASMVALKTETTTKDQGMVVMKLEYGAYTSYGLPDKVLVSMDVKDYKLPQGVAMDYNDAEIKKLPKDGKPKKGTIQLTYLKYDVNKGISDAVFNKPSK